MMYKINVCENGRVYDRLCLGEFDYETMNIIVGGLLNCKNVTIEIVPVESEE